MVLRGRLRTQFVLAACDAHSPWKQRVPSTTGDICLTRCITWNIFRPPAYFSQRCPRHKTYEGWWSAGKRKKAPLVIHDWGGPAGTPLLLLSTWNICYTFESYLVSRWIGSGEKNVDVHGPLPRLPWCQRVDRRWHRKIWLTSSQSGNSMSSPVYSIVKTTLTVLVC